ncbi:BPG_G0053500.mRNA.1.CDS.1 [Saccharomyces cerevisiae]|nr:BPG_G0053500.mRNA.1.CDS.1 [Saccharomyces cerevisiae]CAI7373593.1 BPG_G0053500.mRNA.1.CDS.1 [Saccharomyces cerevisiae]
MSEFKGQNWASPDVEGRHNNGCRMSDHPHMIKEIMEAVSIPVMAKVRIGRTLCGGTNLRSAKSRLHPRK